MQNFIRRIKKANKSLNVLGDMMLQLDIDNMNQTQLAELKLACDKANISYEYLNKKIK